VACEPFAYVRAASWSDAVRRLADAGEQARVIAGGQSLVPMMMLRLARPATLIDIRGAAARTIERADGTLVISALARHVDLEQSAAVRDDCPIIAEAARLIGNIRVRHRGTIGGSLAHGEAAAELACVAVAVGATIHTLGPSGERAVPAGDLFLTHLTTSLRAGEIITHVTIPVLRPRQGSCFVEWARRAGDFAMVEVAALVTVDDAERCLDARLALGAIADAPIDASPVAARLNGERLDQRLVGEVARAAADAARIGSSTHASALYRRQMTAVLVQRALLSAAARARTVRGPHDGEP
jgi:aerobic carbon-monoxide dehydrogenase medium subunit